MRKKTPGALEGEGIEVLSAFLGVALGPCAHILHGSLPAAAGGGTAPPPLIVAVNSAVGAFLRHVPPRPEGDLEH